MWYTKFASLLLICSCIHLWCSNRVNITCIICIHLYHLYSFTTQKYILVQANTNWIWYIQAFLHHLYSFAMQKYNTCIQYTYRLILDCMLIQLIQFIKHTKQNTPNRDNHIEDFSKKKTRKKHKKKKGKFQK